MKKVLVLAGITELATGLALIFVPSLVGQLLLGQRPTGAGLPIARVTGMALLGLGVACWPGPPRVGMLTYSALVALYLAYLGVAHGLAAPLLWPAVVAHLALAALLVRAATAKDVT